MKKFLLSAAMLLLGAVATFAQDIPDASSWKEGDEITSQLSWANLNFENGQTDWTCNVNGTTKSDDKSGTFTGAFEAYNQDVVDLYQYVWLPAGMYKMTCQGYYRGGGSGGVDAETYIGSTPVANDCAYNWANTWEDNAFITATRGTLDGSKFTPDHVFKSPLMPRLYEKVTEQIWEDPIVNGMDGYAGWVRSDYYYTDLGCWGPTSFPGSCTWFAAGKYQPIEGVKYNTVTFFLTEPGCVKVGITKNKRINNDTFFCTDFKMYFLGADIDEAADLMLAQDDLNDLYKQLEDLLDEYEDGFINVMLSEVFYGVIQETYGDDPYDMDKETIASAKADCQQLLNDVNTAITDMGTMNAAIASIEALLNSTNLAGKEALETAVDNANILTSDEYEYNEEDGWDIFKKQLQVLSEARLAYLMSGEKDERGAWNFSSFITNPFFCDPEYTPYWTTTKNDQDVEYETYIYPTIEGVDDALQPENTYATIQEQGYAGVKNDHADWLKISENIKIDTKYADNQWYIQVNSYHGEGATGVTIQHGYPAIGGWNANPSGVPEYLTQTITGLPNGFYSMSALMCNIQDLSDLQYVFIEAGDSKATAKLTMQATVWWGGNKHSWRTNTWQKLSTDMIYVDNGKVTIGSSSDTFYGVTGFQLYYYGETPDYDGMIEKSLTAAQADVESLTFMGDQKKAAELLGKIPAHITTKEEYLAAQQDLAAAVDYINKALAATGSNWKAPENFQNLASENEGDVADFLNKAWDATWDLEDSEDAVYTDAIDFDNRYVAYKSYVEYRASLGTLLNDEAVRDIVSEQNDYLKANVATVEKLEEFKNALGAPVNIARFKEEGADNATLDNPIDVTFLLQNPKFHECGSFSYSYSNVKDCKGWDCVHGSVGDFCNDNLGIEFAKDENGDEKLYKTIAEIWGASDPFVFSQTLNGLPAGTYEIRTHTLYRDGWGPDQAEFEQYVSDEEFEGDDPNWNFKNNHAKVFAEGANGQYRQETPVSYIYSLRLTEPSFLYHSCYDWYEYDDYDKKYNPLTVEYLADYEDDIADVLAGLTDVQLTYKAKYEGREKDTHTAVAMNEIPFDKKLKLEEIDPEDDMPIDVDYFFSQRTIGLVYAVKADYNNYLKKLYINLPEGGTLTLGIDKEKGGGGSSLAMYDWELWYCGTEIPTSIEAITEAGEAAAAEGAIEYYTINGVKLNAPQKGINIIKQGSTVKKVFIQ